MQKFIFIVLKNHIIIPHQNYWLIFVKFFKIFDNLKNTICLYSIFDRSVRTSLDLTWPENKEFAKKCKKKSILFIQLLSPTTTNKRLKKIIKDSHQMNYFISMLSTTGGKLKVSPKQILKNYKKIKKINSKKKVVIGFGITEKTIGKLKSADGLVVGSAICKEITRSLKSRQNPVTNVSKLVKNLKNKIL